MNQSWDFTLGTRNLPEFEQSHLENKDICKKCGGTCCKKCGCTFVPQDFPALQLFSKEDAKRYLRFKLKLGYLSIAMHFSDAFRAETAKNFPFIVFSKKYAIDGFTVFYLRIRNNNRPVLDCFRDGKKLETGCVKLTKQGCPYPFHKRPFGARYLIPQEGGGDNCFMPISVQEMIYKWLPLQDIMYDLAKEMAVNVPPAVVFK